METIGIKSLELCETLQDLFADRKRWTTGCFARDEYGKGVFSFDNRAVSFCLMGGICRVYRDLETRMLIHQLVLDELNIPFTQFLSFNDKSSYNEIYNLVKKLNI